MALFGRKSDPATLTETLGDELDTLRSSFSRIASVLGAAASDAGARGRSYWADTEDDLEERARDGSRQASRAARRAVRDGSKQAMATYEEINAAVGKYPMAAIGVAALVGFTLGLAAQARR